MKLCKYCETQPADPALVGYCSLDCQRAAVRAAKGKDAAPRKKSRKARLRERREQDTAIDPEFDTPMMQMLTGREPDPEPVVQPQIEPEYADLGPRTQNANTWMDSPYSARARARARRESEREVVDYTGSSNGCSVYQRQHEDLGRMPARIRGDFVAMETWKANRRAELAGTTLDPAIDWSLVQEDGTLIEPQASDRTAQFLDKLGRPMKWARQHWHDGLGEEDLEADMIDAPEGWRR